MIIKTVPLSQVLEFIRGITFKPEDKVKPYSDGSVVCMRTKNIQTSLDESDILAVPEEFIKRDEQYLTEGDLLISSANSWELVGKTVKVPALNYKCTAGGFISILRPVREHVDSEYLYRFIMLGETQHKIRHLGKKTTNISNLDRKRFLELQIPLPPLPIQKQIATVLEKADTLRRQCQQMEQELNTLAQSVFLDMFGEYVTADGYAEADKAKIRDLVDYIDYRGKTPTKSESGIPLITAKNVKKGFVDVEPREYIPAENYEAWMTRGLPQENDILFTTEAPLGNVALLGKYEKVVVGQRLIALRSKGRVTHEFLMHLLLDPFVQGLIMNRSSGSTVKGIRTKELYEIELPIPDIDRQVEFSNIYWKIKSLTQNEFISSGWNEDVFNSLSQRAFSGLL